MSTQEKALDIWLRFGEDDPDHQDEAEHEANTYREGDRYRVEWYHTAVGQVSSRTFDTYAEARAFLGSEGFEDFSS